MNEMTKRLHELESSVHLHLEDSRRQQKCRGSPTKSALQFHQTGRRLDLRESAIPDRRVSNPAKCVL